MLNTKKSEIAVIFGGKSSEHLVSLYSANNVLEHIDREKYRIRAIFIGQDGQWYVERPFYAYLKNIPLNNYLIKSLLKDLSGLRYKKTNSLEDKPRSGKPSKLTKKQTKKLKKILLDSPPSRFGGESFGWTTKIAIQYIKDIFGIEYSVRRMEELFHKFGLNLITPRIEHRKSSYASRKVFQMDFKKNSKMNIWIAPSLISTK